MGTDETTGDDTTSEVDEHGDAEVTGLAMGGLPSLGSLGPALPGTGHTSTARKAGDKPIEYPTVELQDVTITSVEYGRAVSDATDPTVTLDQKLTAFTDGLTPDELTVLHDIVHLAYEGSEVQGFMVDQRTVTKGGDPCDGGEVTFANTFALIAKLHVSLHRPPPPGPIPTPYPNIG